LSDFKWKLIADCSNIGTVTKVTKMYIYSYMLLLAVVTQTDYAKYYLYEKQ